MWNCPLHVPPDQRWAKNSNGCRLLFAKGVRGRRRVVDVHTSGRVCTCLYEGKCYQYSSKGFLPQTFSPEACNKPSIPGNICLQWGGAGPSPLLIQLEQRLPSCAQQPTFSFKTQVTHSFACIGTLSQMQTKAVMFVWVCRQPDTVLRGVSQWGVVTQGPFSANWQGAQQVHRVLQGSLGSDTCRTVHQRTGCVVSTESQWPTDHHNHCEMSVRILLKELCIYTGNTALKVLEFRKVTRR